MALLSLRIELFGTPAVWQGQTRISHFRTHNVVLLIALLALRHGRPITREALAEALWPGEDPDRQRSRLRCELSLARQALGDALTRNGNQTVALSDVVTCDVWDFEWASLAAEHPGHAGRTDLLLRAAQIPTADLLPGYYEDAIVAARDRLRMAHYRAILRLVEDCLERGDSRAADDWKAILAERYPEYVSASSLTTDRQVTPTRVSVPAVSSSSIQSHPAQLPSTRFFGREQELQTIRTWYRSTASPILTITGPAGIGKTRLALEALPDAVFVPLEDLQSGDRLFEAIQHACLWQPLSSAFSEADFFRRLRTSPTLLFLDNFEHLVESAAHRLSLLLTQAPQTRFLVTSRSRLEIAGEQELTLAPLPPGPARALFVERARSARPDFGEEAVVDDICALLDGLPLALELAAARALTLDGVQIRSQIADRFAFLVSRRRDISERQRSLRAAFEWSLHLLSPPLLEAFLRLCVFRGGFTLAAADAVLSSSSATLDVLEILRSHSLLQVSFPTDGVTRYHLLNSLREFGQLRASPELQTDARTRHARFFRSLSGQIAQKSGVDELWRDVDNFLAALDTLLVQEPDACTDMVLDLAGYWERTGRTATLRTWLERCLPHLSDTSPRRGYLLERLGAVQMHLPTRIATFEQAINAYETLGDRAGEARLRHATASTMLALGSVREARDQFASCLSLRRDLVPADGPDAGLASTLHMLAVSAHRLDPATDVSSFLKEAESRLGSENTLGLAFILNTRRGHAWERGDTVAARHWAEQTEEIFLRHGRTALAAHMRAWLALPALAEEDTIRASYCVTKAKSLVDGYEDPHNHVFLWHYGGLVALQNRDDESAFSALCYARDLYAELANRVGERNILRLLGNWHLIARKDARRAIQIWAALDSLPVDPASRLPLPERRWQDAFERQAASLIGSEYDREHAAGCQLSLVSAIQLATRR